MLDELLIFTRGGLILWALSGGAAPGSCPPVDELIRCCLLEDRPADATGGGGGFSPDGGRHALKWAFHNGLGLVFVAVYRRVLRLLYVDDLLAAVRAEFARVYDPHRTRYDGFGDVVRQLDLEAQARAEEMARKSKPAPAASRPSPTVPSHGHNTPRGDSGGNGGGKNGGSDADGDGNNGGSGKKGNNGGGPKGDAAFDLRLLGRLRDKFIQRNNTKPPNKIKPAPNGNRKKPRVWGDTRSSPSDKKLDFTNPADGHGPADGQVIDHGQSKMDREEQVADGPKQKGWFSSMFQSIAGNTCIDKSALQPALGALKDRLMAKNVAEEIAEKLCESVAGSLEGKQLGSFARLSSTVESAMEEALLRILTPARSTDILRDARAAREERGGGGGGGGRPYVIAFVGVNGVGKSTSLGKVAYWLRQHGLAVTLAACDTFRSGAVEQLRTHARRLGVPLFDRGYERDPAAVAREAIAEAARAGSDVVLVDTAGRMQDNEPLMRALAKLIGVNRPDLVLFVGEALVGNDAVDQLTKFNQRLADLSADASARVIDGILLTKFDTIDDKVGAALSMVYVSGAPIMFVGCGQSYTDLKKLNVKSIVKTLLK